MVMAWNEGIMESDVLSKLRFEPGTSRTEIKIVTGDADHCVGGNETSGSVKVGTLFS